MAGDEFAVFTLDHDKSGFVALVDAASFINVDYEIAVVAQCPAVS